MQQPYEISTSIGIAVTDINLELAAYPNPINNALTLNISNYNNEKLTYQLYDIQGKLLARKRVTSSSTSIDFRNLPVNIYLIKIQDNNSVIKIFRIVKN